MPRCTAKTVLFIELFCIFIFIYTWSTGFKTNSQSNSLQLLQDVNPKHNAVGRLATSLIVPVDTHNASYSQSDAGIQVNSYEWTENYTILWNRLDNIISNQSLYPAELDTKIATDALQNAKIILADLFPVRTSLKWMIILEGGQKVLFKPSLV